MFSESLLGYKLVLRTINLNIAFTVGYMKWLLRLNMSPVIVVIQHYSFIRKTHQAI